MAISETILTAIQLAKFLAVLLS